MNVAVAKPIGRSATVNVAVPTARRPPTHRCHVDLHPVVLAPDADEVDLERRRHQARRRCRRRRERVTDHDVGDRRHCAGMEEAASVQLRLVHHEPEVRGVRDVALQVTEAVEHRARVVPWPEVGQPRLTSRRRRRGSRRGRRPPRAGSGLDRGWRRTGDARQLGHDEAAMGGDDDVRRLRRGRRAPGGPEPAPHCAHDDPVDVDTNCPVIVVRRELGERPRSTSARTASAARGRSNVTPSATGRGRPGGRPPSAHRRAQLATPRSPRSRRLARARPCHRRTRTTRPSTSQRPRPPSWRSAPGGLAVEHGHGTCEHGVTKDFGPDPRAAMMAVCHVSTRCSRTM